MNDRPFQKVLAVIESVTGYKPKRNGKDWSARCPAHGDRTPSLSIAEGDNGGVLLRCHAGCSFEEIVRAMGLEPRDLMPEAALRSQRNGARKTRSDHNAMPTKTHPTAHDAVSALEKTHGKRSALWTYTSANGDSVGLVVRWDRSGDKDIRPVARMATGWIIGAMPAPRPLYVLPELLARPGERVFIVEGEKSAHAVRALGLLATTSSGGGKAAAHSDWSPLAGKDVLILPDHDEAGEKYAREVVRLLGQLSTQPTVKILRLPDLPPGGDTVEYTEARRAAGLDDEAIRQELEGLADAAEVVELGTAPPPLEYRPFPVEVLPEPIRSFVTKGAQAIGCDASYIGLPLLSVLAAAIGNTRRIELKRGWTEPVIIWTVIVGESGTLKTPAFRLVVEPVRALQAQKLKEHQAAIEAYQRDVLHYEAALAAWKKEAGRNIAAAGDPPEKPRAPEAIRYIVSDVTVEALAPILLANPRGILLARDEFSGWIGGFDRYAGGKADAAHWLSMHNAEAVTVDRKTGTPPVIYVPSASVSVAGGVQPGILARVLGAEHRENGLLARLLMAMPPRRVKHWTEATIPEALQRDVKTIIQQLYSLEPDYSNTGDTCPRVLHLTPRGKAAWITFYNSHAKEHAELSGDLSAAWSKLEGYAARFALVVHCVRLAAGDPKASGAVDEVSIEAGATLSRWFGNEARRVYGVLAESEEEQDRRNLLELIQRRGGRITARELRQNSRQYRDNPEAADRALQVLVDTGFGSWEQSKPGPKGGRPGRIFVLRALSTVSTVYETPAEAVENDGIVDVDNVDPSDGRGSVGSLDDDDCGCPDGEQPPDGIRYADLPEADPAPEALPIHAPSWLAEATLADPVADGDWGEV